MFIVENHKNNLLDIEITKENFISPNKIGQEIMLFYHLPDGILSSPLNLYFISYKH